MAVDQPQLPTDAAGFSQIVLEQWQRLKAQQAAQQAIIDAGGADPSDPMGKNNEARKMVAQNALDKLNSDERSMLPYLKPSTTAASTTAPTTKTVKIGDTEYTYRWDPKGVPPGSTAATGAFVLDTSIPGQPSSTAASAKPPSDPSTWVPIRANPSDPNSKVIALQDPSNSSNRVSVPADTKPDKPSIVDGERGAKYSWDGTTLKTLIASSPEKKQVIQGPGGLVQTWDGKDLVTLQPGQYQAKNGDTMQDVDAKGYPVTRTFQNGQWGTTSTTAPKPPAPGDTKPAIEGGYNVTKTYQGGNWDTTAIGSRAVPEKPTELTVSTTAPYQQFIDSSGKITQQDNPNFQPKTQADILARVGQIQTLMQQKGAEVQGKVGQNNYTAEDALKEYNAWYAQNVVPQQQILEAAKQQAQFQQAQELAKTRASAMTQALALGTQSRESVKDYAAMHPEMANPGFANVVQQLAKGQVPSDLSALTYKAPNPVSTAQQGTFNALKYLDPTAAAATGMPPPNYQNMDISALTRNPYAAPGVQLPTPAPAGGGGMPPQVLPPDTTPAPTGIAAPGGLEAWQQRQAADVLAQRQAAQIPMPAWLQNGTPPPPPSGISPQAAPNFGAIPTGNPWDYAPDYAFA